MKKRKISKIITATRFNKLSLNEYAVSTICTILEEKIQIKNAASVYQFVNLFNLFSLQIPNLSYIERFFTIVSDNESFLELEYNFVSKILASSELLITSEIEVFKVVVKWLNHKIEERSKYAEDLLSKVRFQLLSTEIIRHLLNDSKYKKADGCVNFLNKMIDTRQNCIYRFPSCYHTSRYCNQKYFKLLVSGGYNMKTSITCSNVSCFDVCKVSDIEANQPMKTGRHSLKIVYVKGNIYVFGGSNDNVHMVKSVDKYSLTSKTWSQVAKMNDYRIYFCLSAFLNKTFIIGGTKNGGISNSCLQFDTEDNSWKKIATINEARSSAACAVFKERIVVSGGWSNNGDILNSVESYDVIPNRWSTMPNMNFGKCDHSLVGVKNKLYVISHRQYNCEVFDNMCNKFITIKSPEINWYFISGVYSIKNKIFAIIDRSSIIISYDTNKNEWSEEFCEVTKNIRWCSCQKIPCL